MKVGEIWIHKKDERGIVKIVDFIEVDKKIFDDIIKETKKEFKNKFSNNSELLSYIDTNEIVNGKNQVVLFKFLKDEDGNNIKDKDKETMGALPRETFVKLFNKKTD
jgi:hypothetical protein